MKKVMALTLALLMILSLVACGGDKPTSTPTSSDKPATSTPATPDKPTEPSKSAEPEKPTEPKILNLYTTSEATNAHYALKGSTQIRDMSAGGLYAFMPDNGKAVLGPQLAASEPADVNGDGKTWNITVSPNAKWENGEAITAETFIWSWKMALDPKLVMNGGSNVGKSNYIEIVNASAYYAQGAEGKTPVAWEDVGIKKIDEMTIQITTVKGNAESIPSDGMGLEQNIYYELKKFIQYVEEDDAAFGKRLETQELSVIRILDETRRQIGLRFPNDL